MYIYLLEIELKVELPCTLTIRWQIALLIGETETQLYNLQNVHIALQCLVVIL